MDIVIRATVMFAVVFLLIRILGKRELAEMTPFEFVMLVVIGDLIQQGITHNDFSLTGATLAVSTFMFWGLVLNWFSNKSRRAEKILDSEPAVVVREGELVRDNLKRNRMTVSELESEMRLAGIAHLSQVAWGILETNGKISFIERNGADGTPQRSEPSSTHHA
jgi:uncharacterized membrane protein YcaP (DUF421 family)